jgi:teichuronic acid exporter
MGLKSKVISGSIWDITQKVVSQLISFVANLFLARILSPDDYGLMGMIMIFILISNVLVDSGLGNSIVKKVHITDEDLNTVFWSNLLLSIILYLILFITAPYIANFYNRIELIKISRIVGLSILFTGFGTIQNCVLMRNLDFKKPAKSTIISSIISSGLGIILALFGFKYWALVWQNVTNRLLYNILILSKNGWKPKIKFNYNLFKEHLNYGGTVLGINVINQIFQNIYYIIIGKYFSSYQLGYYYQAKKINDVFNRNFRSSILKVSFPTFAQIQEDQLLLIKGYNKAIYYSSIIIFPIVFFALFNSKLVVISLFTDKWAQAAPMLALLSLSTVFQPHYLINNNLLLVKGFKKLAFINEVLSKGLLIILLFLSIPFGLKILLSTLVIINFFSYLLSQLIIFQKIISIKHFVFKKPLLIIAFSFICNIPAFFISQHFKEKIYLLIINLIITFILYFTFLILFDKEFKRELTNLKQSYFNRQNLR